MDNNKKICTRCGYVAEPDFVFCAKCGTPLPQPTYQPPVEQPSVYQQPPVQQPPAYSTPDMRWIQPQPQPLPQPQPQPKAPYNKAVDNNVAPTRQGREDVYVYNYGGEVIAYEKTLNDLPTCEVSDYIGKNRHRILTKFFKQSYGAKGGWNWMVFLFGMLGVPFVWFFYRKMKKQGIITLIISLALALCMGLTYGGMFASVGEDAVEYFETVADLNDEYGYYDRYDFDVPFVYPDDADSSYTTRTDAALSDFLAKVQKNDTYLALSLISQVLTYLNYALAITVAIFADHWYYKKAMADLKELNRLTTPDCETVMAAGGTKTSAAVLSGIIGTVAKGFIMILCMVPFVLPFFNSIMNIML